MKISQDEPRGYVNILITRGCSRAAPRRIHTKMLRFAYNPFVAKGNNKRRRKNVFPFRTNVPLSFLSIYIIRRLLFSGKKGRISPYERIEITHDNRKPKSFLEATRGYNNMSFHDRSFELRGGSGNKIACNGT